MRAEMGKAAEPEGSRVQHGSLLSSSSIQLDLLLITFK